MKIITLIFALLVTTGCATPTLLYKSKDVTCTYQTVTELIVCASQGEQLYKGGVV